MSRLMSLYISSLISLVTLTALLGTAVASESPARPLLKLDESSVSTTEFRKKLVAMSDKIESSIHTLRDQIAESQSAPFLEDLYLQLAELLSQKSNTLYYIQMERSGGDKIEGVFSPVITAQKESIAVYEKILKDFPATLKKTEIQYRLALALKSIDEIPGFMKLTGEIIHEHPATPEAVRSELLLGQYFYEQHDLAAAMTHFKNIGKTPLIYERNLARYRIGLIQLSDGKFEPALNAFEQVITDPMLKEQDNPYDISLESKSLKSDLKREALVDSVRAYTELHSKDGDAVAYYSRIAPSELHFQEVIEKLAVRYIYLKNYDSAVKLLRSLSERTADPQRVVNIYREVLVMIPITDRAEIPVSEMRYVLEQYHRWTSYFDLTESARHESYDFFEKQIRELATRNHSLAKDNTKGPSHDVAHDPAKNYLSRAKDYYLLYLGNFPSSSETPKMAANLADVYFAQQDWIKSGEYYLRTYAGEFGKPDSQQAQQLIENAILCLQKDAGDSFYETVRRRGLMLRALDSYIASSDKRKTDPALAFLRAKTRYEQGILPESLEELYGVARRFPGTAQATQSGEIILDYFNVRSDFEGLGHWSGRLLSLKMTDTVFNGKLTAIQNQAESKVLREKVRQVAGYDEFAQGQSYLKTALASSDITLSQVALREALAKSREEQDIQTYLKTAAVLGDRELDPAKKTEIFESVAQENRKVGRYDEALSSLKKIYENSKLPKSDRESAFEQAVQTSSLMRNWVEIAELSKNPLWRGISETTRSRIKQGWLELLESPIEIPSHVAEQLAFINGSEEAWLALYKAQTKLPASTNAQVDQAITQKCQNSAQNPPSVCRWKMLSQSDLQSGAFNAQLAAAPLTLEGVQKTVPDFTQALSRYQALSGNGDIQLEIALQLRTEDLYKKFSAYLHRTANVNPDLQTVLNAKAGESDKAAETALTQCRNLDSSSRYCGRSQSVSISDLLKWKSLKSDRADSGDSDAASVVRLQKKIFSAKGNSDLLLDLSKEMFAHKDYHHAIALATQGLAGNPALAADYKKILGCSALQLGYEQEASFHFKEAGVSDAARSCNGI
jgi:tetratricopeptide (TPR) repeat protein